MSDDDQAGAERDAAQALQLEMQELHRQLRRDRTAKLQQEIELLAAERDRLAAGPAWRDWQLTRERMAELEQERNELRASAPEEMIRLRRALSTSNVRLERAEAERDTAQALLVEEQRDHAATRGRLDDRGLGAEVLRSRIRTAEAELERQRPVIEAARAMLRARDERYGKRSDPAWWSAHDQDFALIAAVDALGIPTPSEEG
jgi:hypothetical protein